MTENLYDYVIKEAATEAEKIKTEAREKSLRTGAEVTALAEKELEAIRRSSVSAGENEYRRIVILKRLSMQKDLLSAKRAAVLDVFAELRKKLIGLDRPSYRSLMLSFIEGGISYGDEEVIVCPDKADCFDENFWGLAAEKLKVKGIKSSLKVKTGKMPDNWGIRIVSKNYEMSFTADSLIESIRQTHELEINGLIFGEPGK